MTFNRIIYNKGFCLGSIVLAIVITGCQPAESKKSETWKQASSALTMVESVASFSDVSSTHVHAEAIAYVKAEGIVQGYSDGTFKPNQTINRAEFVKIVIESLREKLLYGEDGKWVSAIDNCLEGFGGAGLSDVRNTDWFAPHVCAAVEASIISGYPDETFKPAQNVNFVEAAKILANAFLVPELHYFDDRSTQPAWYKVYVDALADKKAIPVSISSFDQQLTRGEIAEMIWRLKAGVNDKLSRTYGELGLRTADSVETGLPFSFSYPASWGELEKVGDEYGSWRLMGLRDTQFEAIISFTAKKPGLQFITKPCSYIGCPLDTDFDTYRASLKTNRTTDGGIRVSQRDDYSPQSGSFRRRAEFFAGDYQVMFGGWAYFLVYEKEYDRRVSQGLSPSTTEIVSEDLSWEDEHPMDIVFGLYPSETAAEQRFFMQIDAMIGSIR